MGSKIEFNDTLKLTCDEGLPICLEVGQTYEFCKSERRVFHMDPVRVFLVEDRDGKWNYLAQVQIVELTIDAIHEQTRGKFVISKIYPRDYARLMNMYDAPKGKGLICDDE